MLFDACARAGLEPVRQFPLPGRGDITGFVDAAFVEAKLILEARRPAVARPGCKPGQGPSVGETPRPGSGGRHSGSGTMELAADPDGEAAVIRETYDERLSLLVTRS